ncbi:hypothetical protein [Blastococcus haudaquaticus]|uniref:Uncharacterized protein n=1 Tax=Blastococcus haudaquaticus TaxID=1938745 RepID=A0A286H600_9ACTN|nr:hypothetical protein [Blastococcus haudaquaticus]SOE02896.1 hypothetical protein SAMN06272739_3856 [Blastococcus haudaquaticus]
MTSVRPATLEDNGDRFPGAVPASSTLRTPGADERLVRMHAAYVSKANALVEAGREDLTSELADAFDAESASAIHTADVHHGGRRSAGRGTPTRSRDDRGPGRTTRLGRLTRESLQRFDRYTLDVFNAGSPYRARDDRSA